MNLARVMFLGLALFTFSMRPALVLAEPPIAELLKLHQIGRAHV